MPGFLTPYEMADEPPLVIKRGRGLVTGGLKREERHARIWQLHDIRVKYHVLPFP